MILGWAVTERRSLSAHQAAEPKASRFASAEAEAFSIKLKKGGWYPKKPAALRLTT
jgi:hypothetical protein